MQATQLMSSVCIAIWGKMEFFHFVKRQIGRMKYERFSSVNDKWKNHFFPWKCQILENSSISSKNITAMTSWNRKQNERFIVFYPRNSICWNLVRCLPEHCLLSAECDTWITFNSCAPDNERWNARRRGKQLNKWHAPRISLTYTQL